MELTRQHGTKGLRQVPREMGKLSEGARAYLQRKQCWIWASKGDSKLQAEGMA